MAAHPSASSAIVAGPAGGVLVTASKEETVTTTPGTAKFADAQDGFLVKLAQQGWRIVTLQTGVQAMKGGDGTQLRSRCRAAGGHRADDRRPRVDQPPMARSAGAGTTATHR